MRLPLLWLTACTPEPADEADIARRELVCEQPPTCPPDVEAVAFAEVRRAESAILAIDATWDAVARLRAAAVRAASEAINRDEAFGLDDLRVAATARLDADLPAICDAIRPVLPGGCPTSASALGLEEADISFSYGARAYLNEATAALAVLRDLDARARERLTRARRAAARQAPDCVLPARPPALPADDVNTVDNWTQVDRNLDDADAVLDEVQAAVDADRTAIARLRALITDALATGDATASAAIEPWLSAIAANALRDYAGIGLTAGTDTTLDVQIGVHDAPEDRITLQLPDLQNSTLGLDTAWVGVDSGSLDTLAAAEATLTAWERDVAFPTRAALAEARARAGTYLSPTDAGQTCPITPVCPDDAASAALDAATARLADGEAVLAGLSRVRGIYTRTADPDLSASERDALNVAFAAEVAWMTPHATDPLFAAALAELDTSPNANDLPDVDVALDVANYGTSLALGDATAARDALVWRYPDCAFPALPWPRANFDLGPSRDAEAANAASEAARVDRWRAAVDAVSAQLAVARDLATQAAAPNLSATEIQRLQRRFDRVTASIETIAEATYTFGDAFEQPDLSARTLGLEPGELRRPQRTLAALDDGARHLAREAVRLDALAEVLTLP